MDPTPAVCPDWLATLLREAGGVVPFRQFMDWALFHPDHGYYGAGNVRIGPRGDFATSPSLGSDFASLLAQQVVDLLRAMPDRLETVSIVEVGPGEGDLAADLVAALATLAPQLLSRCELVLVERSPVLRQRQQQRLHGTSCVSVRWCSLEELAASPVNGIVLAHELLDALPVDRVVQRHGELQLQTVLLHPDGLLRWDAQPMPVALARLIAEADLPLPPDGVDEGWCSEWHTSYPHWIRQLSDAVSEGVLLVIDYALEAERYYSARRSEGTLMAYRGGAAALDPLALPGQQDLTSHVCIEALNNAARADGWTLLDQKRQGEALLALGLAERLHALQSLPPGQLAEVFQRREALLRLVDPAGLGNFRWLLYGRGFASEGLSLRSEPGR